jgi:acetyl esterase
VPASRQPFAVRAQVAAAAAIAGLPTAAKLRLSGRAQVILDGGALDPGLQLTMRLGALRGTASFISVGASDPVAERRRIRADSALAQGRRTPVAAVSELTVDGARGPIRARHYAPFLTADAGPAPLLVFAHGGGWVVGDLDTHDEFCRLICRHAAVHVLSLDYGLAPEHPFPQGLEDVIAATRWALREAVSLGADPARVAVAGDSAGGNLATGACRALVAAGEPAPALQVLIYPSTDFVERTVSMELFSDGFFLDAPSRRWCEERYVSPELDRADPRLSPLRGELAGQPPAIVVTAAFDPLRDEGERYAGALLGAGGHVVSYRVPGMIHGFINMTGINRAARDAVLCLAGTIRAELAPRQA